MKKIIMSLAILPVLCACSTNTGEIVLSAIIAFSTTVYTIINWLMLSESKKQRQEKITPLIIAYLKSSEDHSFLRLYIRNIGEGIAKNVTINILPKIRNQIIWWFR
jgi:hypothetical protein